MNDYKSRVDLNIYEHRNHFQVRVKRIRHSVKDEWGSCFNFTKNHGRRNALHEAIQLRDQLVAKHPIRKQYHGAKITPKKHTISSSLIHTLVQGGMSRKEARATLLGILGIA